MKKILLATAVMVFTASMAVAQKKETIEINPGTTTLEALKGDVYLYPEFQNGTVIFKNGGRGKSRMNYCVLINEMQFINPKGDTLALTGESEIYHLTIGQDTFYYNGARFLRQEKNHDWIKTASYVTIKEVNRKKKGGYGETIMGAANELNTVNVNQVLYAIKAADYVTLLKETTYYISNGSNEFTPLKKDSFLKMVPAAKQAAVKQYLKDNAVNFSNLDEVNGLIAWINQH